MKNEIKNKIISDNEFIKRILENSDKIDIEKIKKLFDDNIKLLENNTKTLSFRNANLSKLKKIVNIEQTYDKCKFDAWFNYKYKLSNEENNFLESLLNKNRFSLLHYNEIKLTVKFIGRILNKVDFDTKEFSDWYGYKIKSKLNNYILSGEPDFIVATGIEIPEKPYFFLQEYKRSLNPSGNPEFQLIAGMLASMNINKTKIIRGAYIIGRYWNFIILEKLKNGDYEYFVSDGFDCLKLRDLKKIYINLQAVKFLYCK